MKKIQTAEELFKKYSNLCQFEEGPNEYIVDKEDFQKAMIEFAKMHVTAVLKEASEKAKITYEYSGNTGSEYCDEFVDKDSILNSYPLENIK